MRMLADTHTFLWYINDDVLLSETAKVFVGSNEILISMATLWEIAIKLSIGKLRIPLPFSTFINEQVEQNRLSILNITVEHISTIIDLPFHHRDPFDRMLIAQALMENMPIISRDAIFDAYGVRRIW